MQNGNTETITFSSSESQRGEFAKYLKSEEQEIKRHKTQKQYGREVPIIAVSKTLFLELLSLSVGKPELSSLHKAGRCDIKMCLTAMLLRKGCTDTVTSITEGVSKGILI